MERTIRVTGKGKLAVKPDLIRLVITQTAVVKDYEQSIRESGERKRELSGCLEKLGFDAKALKTLHFDIDAEQEGYQAKDRSWKYRLLGYRYTHRMKLEFPVDNDRLGQVLYEIAHCSGEPKFDIEHTVSDPESAKNELLAKAVADSRAKAEVLTAAAGVQLGEIQLIDYSWGEVEFTSRLIAPKVAFDIGMPAPGAAYNVDIEPDDIDVEDTVTVVWRIH